MGGSESREETDKNGNISENQTVDQTPTEQILEREQKKPPMKRGELQQTTNAWHKLSTGPGEQSAREAVKVLKMSVKDEDEEAMWMLGVCKEFGIGTKKNIKKAEKLYAESSKRNSEVGRILSMKWFYGRGTGTMKTFTRL